MIVTTVVLTNAAQAKCFHSQCRSRMYAVTHQILNLNCILSLEPNGDQWNFGKQHQQGPQNSYPISARGLEGFNTVSVLEAKSCGAETVPELVTSPHTTLPVDTPPLVAVKVQSRLSQSSGPAAPVSAPVAAKLAAVAAPEAVNVPVAHRGEVPGVGRVVDGECAARDSRGGAQQAHAGRAADAQRAA